MANVKQMKSKDNYEFSGETYGPIDSPIYIKNGKKYIKISTGTGSRYLLWRESNDNQVLCKTLDQNELDKIVEKSKYPTIEERQILADEVLQNRNLKQKESTKRKKELLKYMELTEKKRKLNLIEKEKRFKTNYLLKRENAMRADNLDAVKTFNTLVALKKCIATWDLQQMETAKIKSSEKKEKLRQEREAEILRRKRIKEDELQREKENAERQNFITALGQQITERENAHKLEAEWKQLERKKFNKAAKQSEADDLEAHQQKIRDDAVLREEQRRTNVLLQRLQSIDKEEDIIYFEKQRKATEEALKGLEDKQAIIREMELKRKKELEKMAAEKAAAEEKAKFKDLMAEVLRIDDAERVWRQRELAEQREKQKNLEEMYSQLEKQVKGCREAKAQVIEDERREICKIARDNIEDQRKELEAERKTKLANEGHRMEILMQINDIDRRKIQDREDKMLECSFYKIQQEAVTFRGVEGMEKRLEQVKKHGLPKKYCEDLQESINKVIEIHKGMDEMYKQLEMQKEARKQAKAASRVA